MLPYKVGKKLLFNQFFDDKGIEILLGEDVENDYLNDDKIGTEIKMGIYLSITSTGLAL